MFLSRLFFVANGPRLTEVKAERRDDFPVRGGLRPAEAVIANRICETSPQVVGPGQTRNPTTLPMVSILRFRPKNLLESTN
ncbi:TPA: hypothetical protein DIC21_00435 [Candidatus Uhrbacteria bacterium]|nr:hypothetical protein [Candidatus Uhrbacteria bacterium]